jgi:hypothetical protein
MMANELHLALSTIHLCDQILNTLHGPKFARSLLWYKVYPRQSIYGKNHGLLPGLCYQILIAIRMNNASRLLSAVFDL